MAYKIFITIFIFYTSFNLVQAQITSPGMRAEFKQITSYGRRQSGFEGIQTYNSGNVKGSQFFYNDWTHGSVTTTNNEVISNNYLFLFDKVRQELFVYPTDTEQASVSSKDKKPENTLVADKSQITSFTIITDHPHVFEQASIYDPAQKGNFFEVLAKGSNYILLKSTKTTFEKHNMNDMEKVKQGEFNDEFLDHITYYIDHNHKLVKVTLNENNLRKALKEEKLTVDNFFNLHQNDELNEDLLINLINNLNDLSK